MYEKNCAACNEVFQAWRKEQVLCRPCYDLKLEVKASDLDKAGIVPGRRSDKITHRKIAVEVLGRKLASNEVVHHIDINPENNSIDNLMVMTRQAHGRLHKYLDIQRVIIEKSINENQENCWNSLIDPMTTAWLETTGAKVIKLSDIGQSAAEPLNQK